MAAETNYMLQKHFLSWEALESFAITFFSFLAVDAAMSMDRIIAGDFSKDAIVALLIAASRSLIKAIWFYVKK